MKQHGFTKCYGVLADIFERISYYIIKDERCSPYMANLPILFV